MPKDANKYQPVREPSATRQALRARFDAAPKPKGERVEIDLEDGSGPFVVEVRPLTGGAFAALMDRAVPAPADDEDAGTVGRAQMALYQPALIAQSTVDPDSGERLWGDGEEAAVAALPASVFNRLARKAQEVNRLEGTEDREVGKRDSGGASATSS